MSKKNKKVVAPTASADVNHAADVKTNNNAQPAAAKAEDKKA
jgi:hypothetical protein